MKRQFLKFLFGFLAILPLLISSQNSLHTHSDPVLCSGILPPNPVRIPISEDKAASFFTRSMYDKVLNRIEQVFKPKFSALGLSLTFVRAWTNDEANAYAYLGQKQSDRLVVIYGGIARHPLITEDGLTLVACHEVGHHLAGKPFYNLARGWSMMSAEGQADYFASLKCFRQLFSPAENQVWFTKFHNFVPKKITEQCAKNWTDSDQRGLCLRSAMAGYNLGKVLADISNQYAYPIPIPSPETPDMEIASSTIDMSYPSVQCRLDTYIQGSLCAIPATSPLSAKSVFPGTCSNLAKSTAGGRPACWFNESDFLTDSL